MKRVAKIAWLLFFSFLYATGWSQNFPVRVTPVLTPPYTPFITDYTEAGSDKLTLQVLLTDLTVSNYHCKLRLTIEGVNISITTNPDYAAPPLILQGGMPEILLGSDLSNYFNFNNLIFKGISRNEIERNGNKLPEGIYRFSFEVIDYNRNVVVSNKGTATAWMLLNAPPIINLPLNDTKLKPLDPQNIVFQWTPRHSSSPNSAFTTEYEVKLYEIWPKGRNAFDAVNTSQPIYQITTDATMVVYGPAETPLVLGREYALQVKAKDTEGKDLFRNNGLSEVIKFTYGDECPVPIDLQADNISNSKARIKWQSNSLNTGYVLRYREKKDGAEWFEENTTQSYFSTSGLQPATTYEYQLAGQCLSYYSDYSEQKTLTTLIINPSAFICGDPRTIPIPDGSPPLPVLMTNDSINAGGFSIIINKATGTAGKFSGEGIAIIPWFNYAKVRVTFENITVNKSYQLTGGAINSVWDKDSKLLRSVEQLNNSDTTSTKFKSDIATFEADSTVLVSGMILSVTADAAGTITVGTTSGSTITLEKGKSYAIADEVGNGYLVDKEGNIKKTTATDAISAGNKGEREYSADPNRSVLFTRSDQTKYGLDVYRDGTLTQNYQQTENGKYISWKALATGQSDLIQILGEGNTDLSKVKFRLEGIASQQLIANGQQLTLPGNANGTNEEVLAVDNSSDTTKNGQILGKLNLISYNQEVKNLVLVTVNKTAIPVTAGEVRTALNTIYAQAVVSWNVNSAIQHLEVDGLDETKLDDGGSGLLSNYTADMKKVLNAYLNGNSLADDTYYLFFVTNSLSTDKLGYMPRSKQAGFIFTGAHLGTTELLHTIAHELGHGAFHLKHTFSEFPSINEGSSDNLMDYSSGTALDKYQWDQIHNPEGVLGLFEDDEEGAMFAQIAQCLTAAAIDMAMNYAFKWVELNFLDQNEDNNYSILDFRNIWASTDKWEIFSSAATSCAASVIPWPTNRTKLVGVAIASFGAGAVALTSDVGNQYETFPEKMPFGEKIQKIDWEQSFKKAGTQSFIAGISTGIVLYATDHPKFRSFATKVKNLSYEYVESILRRSGFSNETIDEFCKRFGVIKKIASGKYIAKTGNELREYLKKVVKPPGVAYKGGAHRTIGMTRNNPLDIHPGVIAADYRYSKPGETGLYVSETYNGNITEMSFYGKDGILSNSKTYSYDDIQIDNLLDLTDSKVRDQLAVDFEELTRSRGGDKDFNYEFTHEIGTWAKDYYKGIIFPGARGNQDYKNIVIFNQIDVDASFNGKIPELKIHD